VSNLFSNLNEWKAAEAFSRQSKVFDQEYGDNPIIQYKRMRVRDHVLDILPPNSSILELNCGTGEDALFFSQKGHRIHATDIAEGMLNRLREKIRAASEYNRVSTELCSFTNLGALEKKGPYDLVFSNFGGLNCTGELDDVLRSFDVLVKPGGCVTLIIIPKFCLWESLLLLKGDWKTATRRFFSKNGRKAHLEGTYFTCWYYNPGFIRKQLQDTFDVVKLEGLCTLVPPSYRENFPVKYPRIYHYLVRKEYQLKSSWPWKLMGDYFIMTLRKKALL
jgi:ubiquinone/menaquinone biosynthesis C-methylase UbiE